MKTKSFVAAILAFSMLLFGGQRRAGTAAPASKKDVRKIERELRRLKEQVARSEKEAAARSAKEGKRVVEENKAAVSETETNLSERMDSIAREARSESGNQLRTQRIVWSIALGAVLLGIFLLGFWIHKTRSSTRIVMVSSPGETKEERVADILIDPHIASIKGALVKKQEQRFIFSTQDGEQFDCLAELRDGEPFVTMMNDYPVLVAWDKRRRFAAKLAARRG